MIKNMSHRSLIAFVLAIIPLVPGANQLRVMTLDEKVARSDVVIVGTVVATEPESSSSGYAPKYAKIEVSEILKGMPGKTLNVQYKGPIPEEDPSCCLVGKKYLFFLRKIDGSGYVSVNHRLGIYNLTDTN